MCLFVSVIRHGPAKVWLWDVRKTGGSGFPKKTGSQKRRRFEKEGIIPFHQLCIYWHVRPYLDITDPARGQTKVLSTNFSMRKKILINSNLTMNQSASSDELWAHYKLFWHFWPYLAMFWLHQKRGKGGGKIILFIGKDSTNQYQSKKLKSNIMR